MMEYHRVFLFNLLRLCICALITTEFRFSLKLGWLLNFNFYPSRVFEKPILIFIYIYIYEIIWLLINVSLLLYSVNLYESFIRLCGITNSLVGVPYMYPWTTTEVFLFKWKVYVCMDQWKSSHTFKIMYLLYSVFECELIICIGQRHLLRTREGMRLGLQSCSSEWPFASSSSKRDDI